MIDRTGKTAARRTMGEAVPESDIDRLLDTARHPGRPVARSSAVSADDLAPRLSAHHAGPAGALTATAKPHAMTMGDILVFVLYVCLGVFTRIWTDVTLYFDFGDDDGFRAFAIGVSVGLHFFILAIVANAWRAKWEYRVRNVLALAALGGYLGFRMITQL